MGGPRGYERYSWKDYLSWSEEERFELIDGVAYAMSPAPGRKHQRMVSELNRQIANALLKSSCQVYPAPLDVKLSGEVADDAPTVVQPDLTVVCNADKLTEQGVAGAPDLVIEIVSPESGYHDRARKFDRYQRYGVSEYWIVDKNENVLEVEPARVFGVGTE
jgi:Uma2 family endonuclease